MKKKTDTEFQHKFGKMIKGKHSLLLEEGQLSDSQNMLPGYEWKQRKGMTALTGSAVASGLRWKSLCQFRDLQGYTDVILAHTYDSSGGEDLYQGSALPPNAITWTKKYDLTASCEKCQFANVANTLLIANNKDFLIWRGTQHFPTAVWKYDGGNSSYALFTDELFDNDTSTNMPLNSLGVDDFVIVISEMPLNKISPVVGNTNSTNNILLAEYWKSGYWTHLKQASYWSNTTYAEYDCTSLTGWTDSDAGDGASTVASWKGREVFKLHAGTAGAGNYAKQSKDVGTFSDNVAISLLVYFDDIGTLANNDAVQLLVEESGARLRVKFATDGCYVYDGASYNEVGTDLVVEDEWQLWTFVCDFSTPASATCDVYLNGTQVGTGEDCSETGSFTDGLIAITQQGETTANQVSYVDHICVGDALDTTGNALVDGTASSGDSLGQSGDITWTAPGDESKTDIQATPGYAYRFGWSTALDASVTITGLTAHSPMAPVANIWDGMYEPPTGCYVYDGTDHTDYMAYVNNIVESQYMDLSGVTTTDKIYVGFVQRVNKIIFYPAADGKNTNDVSVTAVKYHNASGTATSVGTVTDTTETSSKMFSQKGYMSWADPGWQNEKMTTIGGDDTPMYWYEITVDAALVDPTYIYYIRGVPLPKDPDPSYGVFAYKRRAWQIAPRNKENMVRYSAANLPNVWNGSDSGYIAFGERPLKAAGAFYNETVLYADTEMWMLQGNKPANFGRLRLSGKVGISSAQSLVEVESGVVVSDVVKVVLCWFFFDGIWMFDGVRIWKISAPDIDSFFDPDHTDYINPAKLGETTGEYDYATQTVRWAVYSGSAATTPTKVLVMHFPTLNFGIFDYGTDIDAMLSVVNNKYYLVGGGHSDGRFYQLDSGTTDLVAGTATAVDAYVITRDEFLSYSDGLRQRLNSVWMEAQSDGGQLELDEYPDGSKTPQNIAKKNMTFVGKIFGALQRTLKFYPGQKTTKFRIRNRSKNARMKLLGYSTTVDKGRADE